MASIAFIGLGNMGGPMTANLVKAGHKVVAFDLVAASRDQAKADGAAIAESSVAAVKGADTVITMLPAGKHVLSVWNDVVPSMTKGALLIEGITSVHTDSTCLPAGSMVMTASAPFTAATELSATLAPSALA